MGTTALTSSAGNTAILAFVMIIGVLVVAFSGHVQASALHVAAHDVRHANGFPCH